MNRHIKSALWFVTGALALVALALFVKLYAVAVVLILAAGVVSFIVASGWLSDDKRARGENAERPDRYMPTKGG